MRHLIAGRALLLSALLISSPATSHEWSQAEVETLVRHEILNHERSRQLFAVCSAMSARVVALAESCVERHEMGLSEPRCSATDRLQEGAAILSVPACAVYAAIADRCKKKHYPAEGLPTALQGHAYMACLKHPPVSWLEEETKRHGPPP